MKKIIASLSLLFFLLISCRKESSEPIKDESVLSNVAAKDTLQKEKETDKVIVSKSDDEDEEDDDDEDNESCCNFRYGSWSDCSEGYQVRTWASNSADCIPPLDSIQRTCETAIAQYFYYNPTYTAIRVVCNRPGMIHIYNQDGQISSIMSYTSGGHWIRIGFLPLGIYTAKTYNRTVTFTR
jgi:hypothetical protein